MGLAMSAKNLIYLPLILIALFISLPGAAYGQDRMPEDNGIWSYYTPPRHRPSESHPLRLVAYALHPVGWLGRELVTRPLNYFISSTEVTRSVFGYREPYDYRKPECFSADDSIPDCRSISPYNYDTLGMDDLEPEEMAVTEVERHVYFPDVNFDFDVRKLNDLGRGRVRQISQLLQEAKSVNIVLEGHTDYIGSVEYNDKLGMDRAEAVRQELVGLGVSAEQLSTVTFGKSKPIFAEQEDWARAVNRRVEVHLDAEAPVEEAAPAAGSEG
jgi:hypothetical protein